MLRDSPVGLIETMNGARRLRFCAPQRDHIGSVDPHALKIPARRAEYSLAESVLSPFHAEPAHDAERFAHLFEHIQPLRPRQRLIGFFLIATIAVGIIVIAEAEHQTYLSPKIFLNDPGVRLCSIASAIHPGG